MDKPYLITYRNKENLFHYDWFETEEELRFFVINSDIKVIDCIEILGTREVNL